MHGLDKELIRKIAFQLVNGVATMHTPINGKLVIHRDLKSDNILVKIYDDKFDLKICDFGASIIIEDGEHVKGEVGTRSKNVVFLKNYKLILLIY